MTAWIDTLPSELASAIAESNLSELLAPYRTRFASTFGEAPILSSDEASLDDICHLNHNHIRSAFFYNLLTPSNQATIDRMFMLLANTSIGNDWNSHYTHEEPLLFSAILQFLIDIRADFSLARPCATLFSQKSCSSSSLQTSDSDPSTIGRNFHIRQHLRLLRNGSWSSGAQGPDQDPPTPPISNKDQLENSLRVGRSMSSISNKRRRSGALSLTSSARKQVKALTPHCRPFDRIHTRVLTRKGRSITTFTSAHELLCAFYGAIKGHRSLYENGILHRDVSINNIMIAFPDQHRSDGLTGFLIDLDMAIETSDTEPSGAPHRTGTMEFMAIGTLNGEVHTFRHDLESFYYVFLWICVHEQPRTEQSSTEQPSTEQSCTEQPCTEGKKNQHRVRKTVLDDWGSTFEKAAHTKWGDMGRAPIGSGLGLERILDAFDDWAMELQVLARGIRDILFPVGEEVMRFPKGMEVHDKILNLFQLHADLLQADMGAGS
ncbi:hypothetical protein Q9L58_010091 [Maublancomyces gigas]|uniref:non-specific serine/threonine protein kinase n=1 Tax=Discina gigas TaxID=1032678 RepID=A0ABR3G532_9PEZI